MSGQRLAKDTVHGEHTFPCPVSGKHGFASRALARRFIKQRMGEGARDFTARETYSCEHCNQWHVATPRRLDQRS